MQAEPLIRLPLAADRRLPAPFHRTLPLPAAGGAGGGIPLPVIATRYIPAGIEPQHVLSDCACESGTIYAAQATIDYAADLEPLRALPVAEVLGALVFRGRLAVHGTTILQDMA